MCVVNNYIFTSNGANKLGYFLQDSGQGNAASVSPALGASDKVTALCSSGFSNRFLTGITVSGTAKLYIGTHDDWDADLLWQNASIDSITAIARNGNTVVFAGYDDSAETTTFYYGTLVIGPYHLENQGSSSSNNTNAPAMAYKGNTLVIANLISTDSDSINLSESKVDHGQDCRYGKVNGTNVAFSTCPNNIYIVGTLTTDALAVTWEDSTLFATLCTMVERNGRTLLKSVEPVTCEITPSSCRYYLAKESTVTLGVRSKPSRIMQNDKVLRNFTFNAGQKCVSFALPAGEGKIEIRY